MVIRTFLLVLFLISAALAWGVADYLVVANPLSYTIFNQYMQPISESEQAGFIPYSPFQVIEKDFTLGDQITHAMKFIFQQKEYYLLKDENGTLTGEESKTGRQNFRGAEVLGDTIEALAHGLTIADGKGKRAAIARGTRIARIFRSGRHRICSICARCRRAIRWPNKRFIFVMAIWSARSTFIWRGPRGRTQRSGWYVFQRAASRVTKRL